MFTLWSHDLPFIIHYAITKSIVRKMRLRIKCRFFTVNSGIWLYNCGMKTEAGFAICLCLAIVTAGITIGCKKEPQTASANDSNQVEQQQTAEPNTAEPNAGVNQAPAKGSKSGPSKPTLNEIIRRSSTWEPAFTRWYGNDAPDFTVIDINDKKHTLSEYKGKTVMLIFWATWCGPCVAEIPDLIKLRKEIGEDKLAMLAISYTDMRNTTGRIKAFVAANPVINYPVTATNPADMPRPYNLINSIPCSFFIDPQGKIKLATEGMIPLPEMKAIIEAER
jgi:thiol-disulfide isomerase/thioredoxin